MSKKKIIIIVLSCLAAVALIAGLTVFVTSLFKDDAKPDKNSSEVIASTQNDKSGTPSITVGSAEAKSGDTVKIPVKISNNPGVMAMLLSFQYDNDVLEYVKYDNGQLFPESEVNAKTSSVDYVCIANNDVKKDGDLIYLTFKVKSGAKTGDTKISAFFGKEDIANFNEEAVSLKAVDGKITIK